MLHHDLTLELSDSIISSNKPCNIFNKPCYILFIFINVYSSICTPLLKFEFRQRFILSSLVFIFQLMMYHVRSTMGLDHTTRHSKG